MPEVKKAMDTGEMISDVTVGDLLLEALLIDDPSTDEDDLGMLVDGFPRTALQVSPVGLCSCQQRPA